jgi:hypothetical protein
VPDLFDRHRAERVSRQGRIRLQKPDGLVVITKDDLPGILLSLQLQDSYGIGPRMEQRVHCAGILTVEQLWNATPFQLRRVWGGINGVLFHKMLHGVDIQPPSSRFAKSIGHQHVLEPDLRTREGAHDFSQHLLTKAAERLRRGEYFCRRLGVHLSWVADLGGWWEETDFHETRDTGFLLAGLEELWERVPRYKPLSVGVVLLDLVLSERKARFATVMRFAECFADSRAPELIEPLYPNFCPFVHARSAAGHPESEHSGTAHCDLSRHSKDLAVVAFCSFGPVAEQLYVCDAGAVLNFEIL